MFFYHSCFLEMQNSTTMSMSLKYVFTRISSIFDHCIQKSPPLAVTECLKKKIMNKIYVMWKDACQYESLQVKQNSLISELRIFSKQI